MHNVHETLAELLVPIDSLEQHPDNPREHDLDAIRDSLVLNGMFRPILAQAGTRTILAGHGTWTAALSLGWDQIAVQFLEVDDATAQRILLADNRYPELSRNDPVALLALLDSLDGDLQGTGYTPADATELLSAVNALNGAGVAGEQAGPSAPHKVVSAGGDLRQLILHYDRADFDRLIRLLNGLRINDDDTFTAVVQRCVAAAVETHTGGRG